MNSPSPKHGDCRLVQSSADHFIIEIYIEDEWCDGIASGSREYMLELVENNERSHRKRATYELAHAEEYRGWAEILRQNLTTESARELAQRLQGIEPEHDQLNLQEWQSLQRWVQQRVAAILSGPPGPTKYCNEVLQNTIIDVIWDELGIDPEQIVAEVIKNEIKQYLT